MYEEEIVGTMLTAIAIVLTIFSYQYSLEVGKFVFPFIAGIFTTYVIQHGLQRETEKREINRQNFRLMRERIYGPILKYLSLLLKSVKDVEYFSTSEEDSIDKIRADYLFYAVEKKLGKELPELLDKHEKYNRILGAATNILHETIREEVKKSLQIDIGLDARSAAIRLEVGKSYISTFTLVQAILLEKSPQEFLSAEGERWGKNVALNARFYPRPETSDISKFDSIYASVLNKMKNEPLFVEEKKMRMNLSMQLEKFLEGIKPFVSLQ